MTDKQVFIAMMEKTLEDCPDFFGQDEKAEAALRFFDTLKTESRSKVITENGTLILKWLQIVDTMKYTAKEIGEGTSLGSKKASGSMRKLVADGFVEKFDEKPSKYQITDKGQNFKEFDN